MLTSGSESGRRRKKRRSSNQLDSLASHQHPRHSPSLTEAKHRKLAAVSATSLRVSLTLLVSHPRIRIRVMVECALCTLDLITRSGISSKSQRSGTRGSRHRTAVKSTKKHRVIVAAKQRWRTY